MSKELNAAPQVQPPQSSSLSFTQGFLLGQLSISLLIFIFIKFFIFGEPPEADVRASHRASLRHQRTLAHTRQRKTSSASHTPPSLLRKRSSRVLSRLTATSQLPTSTILAKTYYNVKAHQPESLDWFNVLVAQTIAQLRADAYADDAILHQLTEVLNRPSGTPDYVGEIRITEIALGDEFPILSNCRVVAVPDSDSPKDEGRLQARMDVDLSDMITFGVETKLVLNYPRPFSAVLPVALSVSVVRFSGTLSLSFTPAPPQPNNPSSTTTTTTTTGQLLTFTFLDDYRLDLSVRSLLGSRSRLQDIPKIAQLVESRIHTWFDERCVEPRFQQIQLPSLWPRKKTARGGEAEADAEAEAETEDGGGGGDGRDEGDKMWEAERRAQRQEREEGEGMRWRGQGARSRDVSLPRAGRSSEEGLRMPGGMPGVVMS
ncbi:MAG: ERMES complex subunit mmm1 [Bogoriella megaspora]|nr:MAG: ERMES complex subunit mmm1 [Bogoriella megaspora]